MCGVHPNTSLGYVAAYLGISPEKFRSVDSLQQKRTPKEMSVFLGLPLSQVTRFGKKVSVDDDEKMKSLVT